MNCFWKGILTFWLALLIAGCGGSGASTGSANTVAVTVGGKSGGTTAVFAHYSSNGVLVANGVDMTLTSTALFTSGTVPISSVNVIGASTRFTPLPYSSSPANTSGVLSPAITNPQFANNPAIGGIIPGPGTLDISNIPIFGGVDAANVVNAGLGANQYNYTATLTFNLKESNTGTLFSVSTPVGVIFFP